MSIYLLKVSFKSPVRVGMAGRDDQATRESLPADQVFSWLSLGWIRAFGVEDYEQYVAGLYLSGKPPWRHSDLFPTSDGTVWLPAPRWQREDDEGKKTGADKKFRTPWVRWDAFFEALRKDTALPAESYGKPLEINMINNVRIGREGEEHSTPYYTATVQKRQTRDGIKQAEATTVFTGLLRCGDTGVVGKLRTVLALMVDEGFGGNRSSGLGAIGSCSLDPAPELEKQLSGGPESGRYVLLSPCCPTEKMLADIESSPRGSNSYTVTSRAGWVYDSSGRATDIRKATTYLFESGSFFSVEPEGRLVDVGRQGKVSYRYGVPFVVQG